MTRHTILALCLHLKFSIGGEHRQGLEKLLEDILFVLVLRHTWEARSWMRDASVESWTFLYQTEVGSSLLSSCLRFSLVIPGASMHLVYLVFWGKRLFSCMGCIKRLTLRRWLSAVAWDHRPIWCFINNKKHAWLWSLHTFPRSRAFLLLSVVGGIIPPCTRTPGGQVISWCKSLPLQ